MRIYKSFFRFEKCRKACKYRLYRLMRTYKEIVKNYILICTKNADTFVNNHKCVGKVLTNQEMLSAILRSSSCDIFPIIVCEMPSFSQNSLQIAGCLCFLRIHLVNADTLHDLFYPICGRIIFLTK